MLLELATPENFNKERYLLANPDVAQHVANGGSALEHFRTHGMREARKQVAPPPPPALMRERFARFKHILDASAGAGGQFTHIEGQGAFPIHYGNATYDLSDYDSESANLGFGPFIEEIRANPDKLYLDVGCGFRGETEPNCLYLEVYRSRSADLVMEPACRYPIADNSLDGIGCFAVLEHVERPWEAAAEFRRMLKPGGKVFIDWPFLQPVHGYPSHYYNATRQGLFRMFGDDGWQVEMCDTLHNQTPDHTIIWVLNELVGGLTPEMRERVTSMKVAELIAMPPGNPFWQDVLEHLPAKTVETLACGNSLIAVKG